MSGCTVFVFLSLMEYALVNIVMGDIADIEKKKNSGLTNLLLGVRAGAGPGMPGAAGVSQKPQKSFQAMQVVFVNFHIDVRSFTQYFTPFYATFPCWNRILYNCNINYTILFICNPWILQHLH